jgi:hypothetical protein
MSVTSYSNPALKQTAADNLWELADRIGASLYLLADMGV